MLVHLEPEITYNQKSWQSQLVRFNSIFSLDLLSLFLLFKDLVRVQLSIIACRSLSLFLLSSFFSSRRFDWSLFRANHDFWFSCHWLHCVVIVGQISKCEGVECHQLTYSVGEYNNKSEKKRKRLKKTMSQNEAQFANQICSIEWSSDM